ncbi:hypothetical protein QR680_005383 [Steinernema hermaphroditum]|uniref:GT23 domain-containing protein n=1 Tax=Steinernema hermaphroditum TaxID=289476 RepID=A0AA39LV83_9BILA|nr:hypothetical protein QR680_005383 [Steinernema hermaphroditum]
MFFHTLRLASVYNAMRPEARFSIRLLVSVAIALWVFVLFYIASFGLTVPSRDAVAVDASKAAHEALVQKLERAIEDIDKLRQQNAELRKLAEEQKSLIWRSQNELKRQRENTPASRTREDGKDFESLYSKEHEVMRREIDNGIRELYFYLLDQSENKQLNLGKVGKHAVDQAMSLLALSANFSYVDDSERWRVRSLANLTNRIQMAIDRRQNPENCSKARILVANLNKGCGFGCQLHHIAYAFVTAFGTGRALILQEDGKEWRYSEKGWSSVFHPVSRCSYREALAGERVAQWESQEKNAKDRVVFLPIVDGLGGRPPYLPLSFPRQTADEMLKLHSNPPVFFISQFIWYLMRSSEDLDKALSYFRTEQHGYGDADG